MTRVPGATPVLLLLAGLQLLGACDDGAAPLRSPSETGSVQSADGVAVRYEHRGTGSPALVLVHGWSCDRGYWSAQLGPLSRDHAVVTVDLAGHGESGMGRQDWTIESFGADVAAVVEALDLESVILVGHSMGGDVVFQAARRLPGRVEGLVMVDTYKKLGDPASDEEIDSMVANLRTDFSGRTDALIRGMFPADADAALVDRIAADMAAAPVDVALGSVRSSFLHAREVPGLIRELGVPVIAINPDDAPTDQASMTEYGVDVVVMPGVSHFLMMEEPDRFNALLLESIRPLR